MKTGLFFGSFNPIHIGHMAIANYMVEFTDIDSVWFVISPHNPFKNKKSLLASHFRYDMVELAIGDDDRFRASDIEFNLPQPSYTINTLTYLHERYPSRKFVLLMGADNLKNLHKWKNYEQIVENYEIYVYPRPGTEKIDTNKYPNLKNANAPMIEISSSFIRNAIASAKDLRYYLHPKVYQHIINMHFYE